MLQHRATLALTSRMRHSCYAASSRCPQILRVFSSTSSDALLLARKKHEQKVLMARELAMQQQQSIDRSRRRKDKAPAVTLLPSPPSNQQSLLDPSERHTVANNIQRWCSKDPTFFQKTMEALNLSSLGLQSKEQKHPLSNLANQHRQLYYDSLTDFRTYLDTEPMSLQPILKQLIQVGFGDQTFSKKYGQVRGYDDRKFQLERIISKHEKVVQQKQDMLAKADEELTAVLEATWRSGQDISAFATNRLLALEKFEKDKGSTPATVISDSVYMAVKSVLPSWLADASNDSQSSSPVTSAEDMNLPTEGDFSFFQPFLPPAKRQLKRLRLKIQSVEELKRDVEAAQKELNRQKAILAAHPFPLPREDYEKARKAIEDSREAICQEVALLMRNRHSQLIDQYRLLDEKTDLTKPHEWFGYARLDKRKIIFHCGPTNSGKTYSALERLKNAERGLYLGPLRLLAAEIYENLTSDGVYTNLFTGQERREIPFSTHASATVEMVNLEKEFDVVVIDEIQMIADATRGAAWTKALLGLRCKEIHVCGGSEARTIVKKLAESCGDDFELIEYQRFAPLVVASESLSSDPTKAGCYQHVQPGDCVVAFSRNDIFAIKREIEKTTNYKCCVIYGKLPPQTRADQARLFNDPDSGYDILVASDAIGMGLNLNIRRIIFNSIFKFQGEDVVRLSHSEVKQISGRAGRRNSPYPFGEVTCRDPRDLPYIRECLSTEIEQIEKAALLPTSAHIDLFSQGLQACNLDEATDLYQILKKFSAMATVKGDYFLGRQTEMQMIAKCLKGIPLSLDDTYTLCMSPTQKEGTFILQSFARKLSRGEVCGLSSRSLPKPAKSFKDLSYLCNIYGDVELFLWLQEKFPPSNAVEQHTAMARKETTLQLINEALANTDDLELKHDYVRTALRYRAIWESENGTMGSDIALTEDEEEDDGAYASFSERRQMHG